MRQSEQIKAGGLPVGDDQSLVAEVLRKDRKATAEFVTRCVNSVYAYVCRHLTPRTDAVEDVMQEILLAAWRSLASFRGEAGLRSWFLGIAKHKLEDYYRKRLRIPEI
jgi:RNA polymerase sigma-70 factor (ECF subfamily)